MYIAVCIYQPQQWELLAQGTLLQQISSWIVTMSGWLPHCHVLIMKVCASRCCSTAVACCLSDRHCWAIVIWNMLSCSFGCNTKLLVAQVPSFFCMFLSLLSEKGTAVMREHVYLIAWTTEWSSWAQSRYFLWCWNWGLSGELSFKFKGESWASPDMCL